MNMKLTVMHCNNEKVVGLYKDGLLVATWDSGDSFDVVDGIQSHGEAGCEVQDIQGLYKRVTDLPSKLPNSTKIEEPVSEPVVKVSSISGKDIKQPKGK